MPVGPISFFGTNNAVTFYDVILQDVMFSEDASISIIIFLYSVFSMTIGRNFYCGRIEFDLD